MSAFDEIVGGITGAAGKAEAFVVAEAPAAKGLLGRAWGWVSGLKVVTRVGPWIGKGLSFAGDRLPGVGWVKWAWSIANSPAGRLTLALATSGVALWYAHHTGVQSGRAAIEAEVKEGNEKRAAEQLATDQKIVAKDESKLVKAEEKAAKAETKIQEVEHEKPSNPAAAAPALSRSDSRWVRKFRRHP